MLSGCSMAGTFMSPACSMAPCLQHPCLLHAELKGVGLRAENLRRPGTRSLMAAAALGRLCSAIGCRRQLANAARLLCPLDQQQTSAAPSSIFLRGHAAHRHESQGVHCRGCLADCHSALVKLQADSAGPVPLDDHVREVTHSRLMAIAAAAEAGLQVPPNSRAGRELISTAHGM